MKIIYLVLIFTFNLSAQNNYPCFDMKENVDVECSCKKTKTCYSGLSDNNKKFLSKHAKSKLQKKLLKMNLNSDKLYSKMMSGNITPEHPGFDKMYKMNKKLDQIADKRLRRYEKNLKKKGVKNWQLKKRIKGMDKVFEKTLSDKERKRIKEEGMFGRFFSFINKKLGNSNFSTLKPSLGSSQVSPKSENMTEEKIALEVKKITADKSLTQEEKDRAIVEAKLGRIRSQEFSYNTIIEEPNTPLFSIISRRYKALSSRLDIQAEKSGRTLSNTEKEKVLNSFKELILKL